MAAIAANACVRIRIGTNATTGVTGNTQIINSVTPGFHAIQIAGTFGDSGSIAINLLTNDQVLISASVAEALTFTLGANTLPLGTLTAGATATGSHTLTLATNATSGAVVTFAGTTLATGAGPEITALLAPTVSSIGVEQFGINAMLNTAPAVGAACAGAAPIASAVAGYSTANQFQFVPGAIISAANPINLTTCTISYIANVAAITEAGAYTTSLTFTATAHF